MTAPNIAELRALCAVRQFTFREPPPGEPYMVTEESLSVLSRLADAVPALLDRAERAEQAERERDVAREALGKAVHGKVVNNWLTGGKTVCLVCGELPDSGAHDDQCWVPMALAALTTAPARDGGE
jgi:hypothetical protein